VAPIFMRPFFGGAFYVLKGSRADGQIVRQLLCDCDRRHHSTGRSEGTNCGATSPVIGPIERTVLCVRPAPFAGSCADQKQPKLALGLDRTEAPAKIWARGSRAPDFAEKCHRQAQSVAPAIRRAMSCQRLHANGLLYIAELASLPRNASEAAEARDSYRTKKSRDLTKSNAATLSSVL
jgi:hypothetical protein